MKKGLVFLLTCLLAFLPAVAGRAIDREHILKIYNWADYVDEDLIGEFEEWYEQQTGEPVKIVYQLFDVNEVMLSKIELGHEDFDLVCPSDYIIERMLRSDLLLPIDRDFGQTPDYIGNLSPFIVDKFNQIDGSGKNANDYAVGYMWGTTGIMYNPKYVTAEEASDWEILKDPRFKGKVLMKDAFRDVYTSLLIALNKERIERGEVTVDQLSRDASNESIAQVENWLNEVKDNVSGWEADFGKEVMTKEKAWLNLTWSGDAYWAQVEAEKIGVKLDYEIPKAGSTVWFDGWVIPKYAKNPDAARYFINYMCKPENAIRNMIVVGYVVAVGGEQVLRAMEDPDRYEPIDASYFFGEGAEAVCLSPVLYPPKDRVEGLGMLHDSGARTEQLLAMWSRVKGDNASAVTYIIIGAALVAVLVSALLMKSRKKGRKHRVRR